MTSSHKILSLPDLLRKLNTWRIRGDKVVFTNGCFDLVHMGHVQYLEAARSLGDRLVLGLNSDSSVRELKGDSRPIVDEWARAGVLAGLTAIDAICIFSEETPAKLIEAVGPDILVKGGDYQISEIVGADYVLANGGEVQRIDFLPGHSTSRIVEKIKKE
ncbi:MAG: D-glycero-beta-D-manno-heptose 1-phosphate adenylyltransferase [Bacteroidia bacterium]|nr:D-glycero-beta-D-manno-heptose 1-phosphate adenylyltransferase [Bacteroidia bacterium]